MTIGIDFTSVRVCMCVCVCESVCVCLTIGWLVGWLVGWTCWEYSNKSCVIELRVVLLSMISCLHPISSTSNDSHDIVMHCNDQPPTMGQDNTL